MTLRYVRPKADTDKQCYYITCTLKMVLLLESLEQCPAALHSQVMKRERRGQTSAKLRQRETNFH